MAKAKAKRATTEITTESIQRGRISLIRDPRVWAKALPRKPLEYKRIIGLDFSSTTGAAFIDVIPGQPITDGKIFSCQWNLGVGPHDTNSIRYVRLKYFLQLTAPDLIFYEEVKYTGQAHVPGMKQNLSALVARAVTGAQVVHSLSAVMLAWAEQNGIPVQSVPISTLKKYATGKGNANKVDMINECNVQFGTDLNPVDYESSGVDNIADATFLCAMAVENCSEGLG